MLASRAINKHNFVSRRSSHCEFKTHALRSIIKKIKIMPTPFEILSDPISLIILAMYATLMLWEANFPGRKLPYVKYWVLRGIIAFFVYFFISSYLPLFISPFLEPIRLFDLSKISVFYGTIIGVLLLEFGVFAWHYCLHRFDFLWRTFHQLHHSAERLDTYGAFFFSPLDMIGWTVLSTVCFSLIVGLSPQVITMVLLITTFMSMFQHANIKTPHWLGYIIQRPESHSHHHAAGIHRNNYSDLPLFDILFGTFYNPKNFEHEAGFYHGASARIAEMLIWKDVTTPAENTNIKNHKNVLQ
jgi:sterol desaturase/sphingolipid hydroxylase (fatty acid hydroxylase superfamily)